MELHDIPKRRRMVRSYLPDPVPHETLERVVATVRRVPSGGLSQGHRLVVFGTSTPAPPFCSCSSPRSTRGSRPASTASCSSRYRT